MEQMQTIPGTRDILPDEAARWQWMEAKAREVLANACYQEIRTPMFEATELFARGIGEATDVVGKEMYTFSDRGDRSITLRPENTAGVARAYIQHNLQYQGLQRLWYIGPMFRYERSQEGRQRQFHQLGLECVGSADPRADAEVIALATQILKSVGLPSLKLDINSVGQREDRLQYREALVNYFTPYKDELDKDSQDRLTRNPLRILDSKDKRTGEIVRDAPSLLDYLGEESKSHFARVQALLSDLGIAYQINPRLVRGLDYYTHTAFEIQSDDLGAQATVCGGGRYDGLISELGGKPTPAVGWAMGLERLMILVEKLTVVPDKPLDFYLVSRGELAERQSLQLAQQLRETGFSVQLDLSGAAIKKQVARGDKSGASACLIIGEQEAEGQQVQLKWMATKEQNEISQSELLADIAGLRQKLSQIV
ncbi:histidine--tRNA ligase [Roseofilum casamattae]|uniref:Histidine--tRNA ligase n=1 Tax=Roseofilum casamattae BLCC-M143 TaxID=3022442 RepID=A0ABT7BV17_9CYAN|nr:histidine--tRNA ligase [Roseofilum casamattae BLCC-M143]